jgi:glycosyltransferase involved in cell wall biosynthesis
MVVWGIRRSTKMLPVTKPIDLGMFALGAMLSHRVDRVVYNSECGRDLHLRRGYCEHNAVVIANGFDTQYFRPDWEVRRRKRATWGVDDEETLIGIIGRIDPVKDHHLFLQTAARIVSEYRTRFVVVGGGSDSYVKKLQQRAKRLGIEHRVLWVGETDEMVDIYNALDIVALCSKEEGFPNVIGEAMACGVPCIITDVGDAALMVGDTGLVVPPGNSEAMAAAWIKVLNLSADDRHRMGLAARERIAREYGIELMVARTSALLEGLVLSGGATRGERCR